MITTPGKRLDGTFCTAHLLIFIFVPEEAGEGEEEK